MHRLPLRRKRMLFLGLWVQNAVDAPIFFDCVGRAADL